MYLDASIVHYWHLLRKFHIGEILNFQIFAEMRLQKVLVYFAAAKGKLAE